MASIRYKLDEAKHFLSRMETGERLEFRYNLSAFLSAFRSTALHIERALENDPTLKAWYQAEAVQLGFPQKLGSKWQPGSDPVLNVLKSERDVDIHEKPLPLRTSADVHTSAAIAPRGDLTHKVIRANGNEEEPVHVPPTPAPAVSEQRQTTIRQTWYFDALPQQEVLPACQAAVPKLEALVNACQAKGIS